MDGSEMVQKDSEPPDGSAKDEKIGITPAKNPRIPVAWLHPAIVVKKNEKGNCLVTTAFIPAGTVVWRDTEEAAKASVYTLEEVLSWPKEEYEEWKIYNYQADETHYRGTRLKKGEIRNLDISEYFNHSCDPNVWQEPFDELLMTARRDIQIGEEVTCDYCTSETENSLLIQNWKCLCRSQVCRGQVTGEEYKDPQLQKLYAGRWSYYIQDRISKLNGQLDSHSSSTTVASSSNSLKRKAPSSTSPSSLENSSKSAHTSVDDSVNSNSTSTDQA